MALWKDLYISSNISSRMGNISSSMGSNISMITCKCGYSWKKRTDNPVSCPECKSRLSRSIATPTRHVGAPAPDDDYFIERAAQKLKYVRKDEWELRLADLKTYCEENNQSDATFNLIIKRAMELKDEFKAKDLNSS